MVCERVCINFWVFVAVACICRSMQLETRCNYYFYGCNFYWLMLGFFLSVVVCLFGWGRIKSKRPCSDDGNIACAHFGINSSQVNSFCCHAYIYAVDRELKLMTMFGKMTCECVCVCAWKSIRTVSNYRGVKFQLNRSM